MNLLLVDTGRLGFLAVLLGSPVRIHRKPRMTEIFNSGEMNMTQKLRSLTVSDVWCASCGIVLVSLWAFCLAYYSLLSLL